MKLFGSTQKKIIDKTIIVMRIKYLSGCSSVSTRQLRRQLISTKVWGITYFYGAVFFFFFLFTFAKCGTKQFSVFKNL